MKCMGSSLKFTPQSYTVAATAALHYCCQAVCSIAMRCSVWSFLHRAVRLFAKAGVQHRHALPSRPHVWHAVYTNMGPVCSCSAA